MHEVSTKNRIYNIYIYIVNFKYGKCQELFYFHNELLFLFFQVFLVIELIYLVFSNGLVSLSLMKI